MILMELLMTRLRWLNLVRLSAQLGQNWTVPYLTICSRNRVLFYRGRIITTWTASYMLSERRMEWLRRNTMTMVKSMATMVVSLRWVVAMLLCSIVDLESQEDIKYDVSYFTTLQWFCRSSSWSRLELSLAPGSSRQSYQSVDWKTCLARSATLEDTSWARLATELTSRNLSDSQLCLEYKTESILKEISSIFGSIWGSIFSSIFGSIFVSIFGSIRGSIFGSISVLVRYMV